MNQSVKLSFTAYHNVTVHTILIYKEILRVQISWRILISSQNKSKGIAEVIVTYPRSSLQCILTSVHSYILSLNSKIFVQPENFQYFETSIILSFGFYAVSL